MENNKDTVVSKTTEKNANKKSKSGFLKRIGNFFVRTWGKIKEVFSELKKVTWPTFPTAMKQLGCDGNEIANYIKECEEENNE